LDYEKRREPGHFIVLSEKVADVEAVTSRIQRNAHLTVEKVDHHAYLKVDSYDPMALYSQPTFAIFVRNMSDQQIATVRCESGVVAIYANAYILVE
jgi:hypothetical protein